MQHAHVLTETCDASTEQGGDCEMHWWLRRGTSVCEPTDALAATCGRATSTGDVVLHEPPAWPRPAT